MPMLVILIETSKAKVGQVLMPWVAQLVLGIRTQRWAWVPVLGLGSRTPFEE